MIRAYTVGTAEVSAKLDQTGRDISTELGTSIGRLAIKLQRRVMQDKLSGQVLKVKTGRLRRSIAQAVVEEGGKVVGIVSSAVAYAPFHEYGFDGTEHVREHLRRSKAQFSARKTTKSGRETAASARKAAGSGSITVKAHDRKVHYPAHSFLRTALRDLEASGDIRSELDAAIKRAIG